MMWDLYKCSLALFSIWFSNTLRDNHLSWNGNIPWRIVNKRYLYEKSEIGAHFFLYIFMEEAWNWYTVPSFIFYWLNSVTCYNYWVEKIKECGWTMYLGEEEMEFKEWLVFPNMCILILCKNFFSVYKYNELKNICVLA